MRKLLQKTPKRFYDVEFKFKPVETEYSLPLSDYNGLDFDEVIEKREKFLSPSMASFQAFEDRPFYNTRGRMQYIYDEKGRQYLDLLAQNQTISVGHNHPRIMKALKHQMDNMLHSTTMYFNDQACICAEKLVETLPKGEDWVVHFFSSGAEAVDLALLLARTYTESFDIIAIRNCYHGLLSKSMDLTSLSKCKQQIPHGFGVKHVVKPDEFRGLFRYGDEDAGKKYAEDVKDTIFYETSGSVAGFIFEPIQGYGGVMIQPKDYVKTAAEYVREAGGVIIADEIQTGFGRTGEGFWGFEMHDIVPDIVTIAKGFGNGLPLAAVAAKREITEPMAEKAYFTTYGGNPTCVAAGVEVLNIIEDENTQESCKAVGKDLKERFEKLKKKYSVIGDCRGIGLMQGIEIVKDQESNEPSPELTKEIFEILRDNGVIPGKGGTYGNVFRINPPFPMSFEDNEFCEKVFGYAIEKAMKNNDLL